MPKEKRDSKIRSVIASSGVSDREWRAIRFYLAVIRLSVVFEQGANLFHQSFRLRQPYMAIINTLFQSNGVIQQQTLIKHLRRSRQAVFSSIKNLEKMDIITREKFGQDQRKKLIRLTDKGWRLAKEIRPIHDKFFGDLASYLSVIDSENLIENLNAISKRLEDDVVEFKRKNRKSSPTR
jgi:DNA-binding MarR family transcriptional regulator